MSVNRINTVSLKVNYPSKQQKRQILVMLTRAQNEEQITINMRGGGWLPGS